MNRSLACIVSLFLIISCSTSQQKEIKAKDNEKSAFIPVPPRYIGLWVNEGYLEELSKTRSTKIAQGSDNFYRINNQSSIMKLDLHEGGEENILLMKTPNIGQIFSSDSTKSLNEVAFKDMVMIIDGKRYVKAPDYDKGLQELVNKAFFSGQYLLRNRLVEFNDNGSVIGLDSIQAYELNLDYADAGMQFDRIYLKYKGIEETKDYLYEFKSDTLIIREINCLAKEEDSDYCLDVEKGPEKFVLIKK